MIVAAGSRHRVTYSVPSIITQKHLYVQVEVLPISKEDVPFNVSIKLSCCLNV